MDIIENIRTIDNVPVIEKIQHYWKFYLERCRVKSYRYALDLMNVGETDIYDYVDATNPDTSAKIIYIVKYAKITTYTPDQFWYEFIDKVYHDMSRDIYTGGPGAIYYNATEDVLTRLNNRFILGVDMDIY